MAPEAGKNGAQQAPPVLFPVIGIGASAGGLEALELFFRNVPQGSGLAFVVVQHMDPTKKGALAELLQRATDMPVQEVEDGVRIAPEHVYVIAPNTDLSILGDVLHLFAPTQARGLRLPIDFFLRSLADDRGPAAIGVILSGMGSDGMLGLGTIKEKGGGTFVQEPGTAKFDGMPRSAIDAGLADVVAPVEELPGRILAYLARAHPAAPSDVVRKVKDQSALEKVLLLLRSQTGHDFSLYKKSTIYRRIERRMGLHQIDEIPVYMRYLQENRQEIELLFKELLIGVTSFFRDPLAWEYLKTTVIPALLASQPEGGTLRAWAPGCSTGEEAYSLAMVFKEAQDACRPPRSHALLIFATDLDRDAIDKARAAVYPENIAVDVSPERLRRFFIQVEHGFKVGPEIRETVVFAPHNVTMNPPFTKLDILICRNLLIYLDHSLQQKLLPLFHYSLNPGGTLFLGSAETVGTFTNLFTPLENKLRLYRRLDVASHATPVEFPSAFGAAPSPAAEPSRKSATVPNIQIQTEQLLLQYYAPAAVLTTDKGDIVYISGRTGRYLEPAAGKANWNVFAMARGDLHYKLDTFFLQAVREKTTSVIKNVHLGTDSEKHVVDVVIHPVEEPSELKGMVLIVFLDVPDSIAATTPATFSPDLTSASQMDALGRELLQARSEAKIIRLEMQTSQEELRLSNEELQSANEELQSTNVELTTSKEEIQSMNEELQTVNHELKAKFDDLSRANNDMKNLLNSTDIATLFLNDDLSVRRFTTQVASIFKLIPGDVGRPITDIVTVLDYPDMIADAREVLRSLVFQEKALPARDGRWFLTRIMPYRTLDNRIDGLVITLSDVSASKRLEERLREKEHEALAVFGSMPNAFALLLSVFDPAGTFVDGRFVFVNEAFVNLVDNPDGAAEGRTLREAWPGNETSWLAACRNAAEHGVRGEFDLFSKKAGKTVRCSVYRPDEKTDRFCLLFEAVSETREGRREGDVSPAAPGGRTS
ncbi:chemotaxis protein CheB [Desulfolutivibrio sulfoxidireducens]|nr:chemotaxis protein CheB [Desulfolutivibrio sulfoxidireducens]